MITIATLTFIQLLLATQSEARLVGPEVKNELKWCSPNVQSEINSVRKEWRDFEFYCEAGHLVWFASGRGELSEKSWPSVVRKHLGLFELNKEQFAFIPEEGMYYQVWNGLPINHGHFSWSQDSSTKKNEISVRTTRTSSWKQRETKTRSQSRIIAEKLAQKTVWDQFKQRLKIEKSVLMVTDNYGTKCRNESPQYIWVVIGEESSGHLECIVSESVNSNCPIMCARDARYAEAL